MKLLIDTCTWLKLEMLNEDKLFDPLKIYDWTEIEITHQVLKELEYYDCKSIKKEKTKINPIENKWIYKDALSLNFDEADASILSFGRKSKSYIMVSEDGALLEYARINNFTALQLIDLFRICFQKGLIESRKLYHLVKYLRKKKNITKRKRKEILEYHKKS
ncbi:MAG: hypothetical protein GF329_06550 [Candidatus Lokiarchaeota archaeon]|nr:hypothetical protein [Candidatus Lokiarchaeota archaeon]